MSDKVDREIDEILKRFDESGPKGDTPHRARAPLHTWAANLRRAILSRLPHVSRRRIVFASLVLAALIAAGLFFGPIHPSFGGSESSGSETSGENVDDLIGEGVDVDVRRVGESAEEGADTEEGGHGADGTHEEHDESHHEGGGEQH